MPWTTPTTVSAGQVLTAARYNQDTVDNILMGNPVFTNEAARDAVITAPSEGQMCYLTAPTVPAATGATTLLPTGVKTVYNGSVWVCVTEVGARSETSGTTTSTSYVTTLTGDGTAISVTLVTGTSVYISHGANAFMTTSGGASNTVSVSGATTLAAADTFRFIVEGTNQQTAGGSYVLNLATAGTNTFTLNYKVNANTGTYIRRWLTVKGIA